MPKSISSNTENGEAKQMDDIEFFRLYFDAKFYVEQLAENEECDNPLQHYYLTGWKLGLDPSPKFSTSDYLSLYPDVQAADINPLEHFVRFGRHEGRLPKKVPAPKPASAPAMAGRLRNMPQHPRWNYDKVRSASDLELLDKTGLFDRAFYRQSYADLSELDDNQLIVHFLYHGGRERRNPSRYFDCSYYFGQIPSLADTDTNPLIHYLRHGEAQGLRAVPWFWAEWYSHSYKPAGDYLSVIDHYIGTGRNRLFNPNPFFDAQFYLASNPDLDASTIDPWLHYLKSGYREGRKPGPLFDPEFVAHESDVTPAENPLSALLEKRDHLRVRTSAVLPPTASELYEAFAKHAHKGEGYESFDPELIEGRKKRAKPIAFYLPQFHSIAENDQAWGKGFTEWRNTSKAMPRFHGHFQPRIPEELGHYTLNDPTVFERQIALAKAAGIHGFCFYYYWFNRKRALEKPIDLFLDHPEIDFPFAIMWANENWTRRWDGQDEEVIFRQDYMDEDEAALIDDLARHFKDPRYIRVDGRPLFILYRPNLVPEAKQTIARWRQIFRDTHGMNPHILMVQGFGDHDPEKFGLDGAVEFPPHHVGQGLEPINQDLDFIDPDFAGNILSYDDLANRSRQMPVPAFPLIKGVIPSWDNEARRGRTCTVYHGSTPEKYEAWLRKAGQYASLRPFGSEPLVFINAWNEWAEAAYLEPDVYYGGAYLNATARALTRNAPLKDKLKLLYIGHDAHPHGAQINALKMVETFVEIGCDVRVILLEGGVLVPKYEQFADVIVTKTAGKGLEAIIAELATDGFELAITNTVVTGHSVPILKRNGFTVISLVHELPRLIADYRLEKQARDIATRADRILFAAEEVRDGFQSVVGELQPAKVLIRPQGCYFEWEQDEEAATVFRESLGLRANDRLVLNVGYADTRKGFDLFAAVAKAVCAVRDDVHFAWLGKLAPEVNNWFAPDIRTDEKLSRHFHFIDFTDEVGPIYEGSDLFFLSSREDPFPTVLLEAMRAGLPIIGYRGAGGGRVLFESFGALADRNDIAGTASLITGFLDKPEQEKIAEAAGRRAEIAGRYNFRTYVRSVLELLKPDLMKVDVVVPNYNYADFLESRLDSIYDQTYPLHRVLVLDDKSPDDSLTVLDAYRTEKSRRFEILANEFNSGSGYLQWAKGARMLRGDYIWIAEADDLADPEFLARAVDILDNSDAAFVFADSRQIDENDASLAESYGYYYADLDGIDFSKDFILPGEIFVGKALAIKNIIMNVSGVLWRREALFRVLDLAEDDLLRMKVACDWKMYAAAALEFGTVGYISEPLNVHRRHSSSVTHSRKAEAHYAEIQEVQDWIASQVKLDQATLDRREAYRREVRAYLGLDKA